MGDGMTPYETLYLYMLSMALGSLMGFVFGAVLYWKK